MSTEEDETSRTNFGFLLNQLPPDQKSLVRYIEKIDQKIVNQCLLRIFFIHQDGIAIVIP